MGSATVVPLVCVCNEEDMISTIVALPNLGNQNGGRMPTDLDEAPSQGIRWSLTRLRKNRET